MKMANDTQQKVNKQIQGIILTIGQLQIPVNAVVVPNVEYDMILGKDFLQGTESTMDMAASTATFQ
jgi:hypothetical protein